VQWRETDFDYVSRLLEDEGIFYWFTDADVMVLGDNPDSYEATGTVLPHRAAAGESQNADAVHEIGSRAALVPGKVTLRDWNTEHPRLDMDVSAPTGGKTATEWYDYPGEYETPPEGIRKARLVAESFARQSAALTGTSSAGQLFPGSTFELVDTPVGADDGKVVVRKVTHDWHRTEQGFTVRFEADDARLTYRPPRETYVPTILNPLTGTVTTSSPSEDIHCDHFGRVKVHFHWDRLRPYDDDCSHWIPVLQDNTGGSSAIPRKDWEVLVHFMEGDPDRPVVLGRVYNGEDQFTEILPHSKTRSGLKSMTTPTRDGSNEIRFDDLAGSEQIFVHAERDQTIEIANNRTEDVWNTQASAVKNDESITVGNDAKWEIGKDMTPRVDNDQSWDVGGDRKLEIGANEVDTVALDRTIDIGGNYEITAGFSEATGAKKLTEKIGGSMLEEYKTMHTSEVGDTLDLVVKGSLLENAKQSKVEAANVHKKETISGMALTATGGEVKMRFDQYRHTKVGGFVMATAKKELTLTGASKFMTVSPTATYTGAADITLKVKDTVVLMKDGLIKIKSPQKVSLLISGNANEGASISTQI
jgi:type VI secretion system secreted protein VgrG